MILCMVRFSSSFTVILVVAHEYMIEIKTFLNYSLFLNYS